MLRTWKRLMKQFSLTGFGLRIVDAVVWSTEPLDSLTFGFAGAPGDAVSDGFLMSSCSVRLVVCAGARACLSLPCNVSSWTSWTSLGFEVVIWGDVAGRSVRELLTRLSILFVFLGGCVFCRRACARAVFLWRRFFFFSRGELSCALFVENRHFAVSQQARTHHRQIQGAKHWYVFIC